MKRSLLRCLPLISLLVLSSELKAQVGVGTTSPHASSILDLTSTTKGMLVPRLTAAEKMSVSSPATGLLIYQTDDAYGFWYFDGTNWIPFLTPEAGWLTTGNSGTVDGTHFLGTLDDVPLYFRVNNTMSGRVSASDLNTYFGYNAGTGNSWNGSTFVGYRAGQSNTTGSGNSAFGVSALRDNTTGTNNTAIGSTSMLVNSTGFDNTGMGENTLYSNTTGAQNTATGSNSLYSNTSGNGNSSLGQNSLYYNTTGNYNSAVGVNSLRLSTTGLRNVSMGYNSLNANTTGSNNTAAGYTAGSTNTTGSNNTFIGSNADASAVALSNATAIGYNAVVGASNCLVLGGSGANLVKVGMGVSSPTNTLSFDGTAARTVWMERNTTAATAGFSLTVQSGGAYNTGTNLNGGDLNLSSGTATGTGSSNIYFKAATAGASGAADNVPATKMTILGSGNVGVGTTGPTSTFQVTGSVAFSVRTQSGATTLAATDHCVINTGAAATWTLPAANTCAGRVYIITNHGTGSITTSVAYRTANGTTSTTVAVATSVQIISDGTEWRRIN
ncbi:MAG TPA: hypothetical protein VJY62_14925 [Bacteroidia bacterium]|nr:hypothetical protein [Bacteroidia bacterium]